MTLAESALLRPQPMPIVRSFPRGADCVIESIVVLIDGGKATKVKYAELKKEQAQLKTYLDSLSAVLRPTSTPGASRSAWPFLSMPTTGLRW